MPKTRVKNDTENMLCLWLEPWGSDHWMRPGEEFTVVTEGELEEAAFNVVIHDQGISVWVNTANAAEVFDKNGNEAPCGHQRPIEATRQFLADAEQLLEHVNTEGRSPMHQEMARTHYERLRQELAEAEARQDGKPHVTDGVSSVLNSDNSAS
ncbi:hypothetical protein ACH4E7_41275 [Kitasatospora sp. NPDC018058]|uniref:hypothetical protein n=1 Tax=Kitasatospora sp. NPDC018058 TaxID=3364025 RepID=UPI0037BF755E